MSNPKNKATAKPKIKKQVQKVTQSPPIPNQKKTRDGYANNLNLPFNMSTLRSALDNETATTKLVPISRKRSATKQPANKQPANKQPANKQPANKQPANKQLAKKQPAKNQPVKNQPAKKQPAKKQPTNFLTLPRELRHEILSMALQRMEQNPGSYKSSLRVNWCTNFINVDSRLREDVEYVARVFKVAGPKFATDLVFVGGHVLKTVM